MSDGFEIHLATIPPGSKIVRAEDRPGEKVVEWLETDGSRHIFTLTVDLTEPSGFRAVHSVCTFSADLDLGIGFYSASDS